MTTATHTFFPPLHTILSTKQIGRFLLLLAAVLTLLKFALPAGLIRPPQFLIWPLADWINASFLFLKDDLGLIHVTRAIAFGTEQLINTTANILYGKNNWPRVGPLPWTVVAITAAIIGYSLNGWRLALLTGGTFVWIALLGQWKWAMETLSVIVVATPISVFLGLVLGIAAWRRTWVEKVLNPILNIAQSLPHFAYMLPVVIFIGVGPKAGAIVTIIFATPPMIRMTLLGLKMVPPEVVENGKMCGSTRWQLLRHVWLPTARTEILIGVNQVIMQCLAMVVLASFIGMPGLGQKLLQLLQALRIGRSIEIGITIVLIAITLDRCSKAWAYQQPSHFIADSRWWIRQRLWLIWLGLISAAFLLSAYWPLAYDIKRTSAFTLSKQLDAMVDAALTFVDPVTLAIRTILIKWILIPIRDAYLWLPFSAVLALLAGVGWITGGARSALICFLYIGFIALSGWWDRAMITAYTVSFAVLIATLVGLSLGMWAANKESRSKIVLLICDTAQTFPSFIYLIPAIMLFGVNDVAVIGAVVIFGTIPVLRYTIEGMRNVPVSLIEAADMSGASRHHKLWSVKFPMALPTILIGANQCVLFSLFMVVIAAFIGTQDLGQEMQRALSATDVGKGLVLGLCVAFMGLLADHLLSAWSSGRKKALGIT